MHIIASSMASAANRTAVRNEDRLIRRIDDQRTVERGFAIDSKVYGEVKVRVPLFDRASVKEAQKVVVNPAFEMFRSSRMSKEQFKAAYPVCARQAGL